MNFPSLPNAHALAVMLLTLVALYLFTRERLPLESTSLAVLVALTVGFEVFPFSSGGRVLHGVDFFLGFGHEGLIAVCALMVAGRALVRTGALEPVGRWLVAAWRFNAGLSMALTLIITGAFSAFMNNTPIVVLMLPILVSVALKINRPASAMLMPMGFATILGGMSTTIGTSTNLLVVSVAADMGQRHFEMFDFALPAVIAGGIGILYLWLVVPRLLPARKLPMGDASQRVFAAQLLIPEDSFADERQLSEVIEKTGGQMQVRRIQRGPNLFIKTLPDVVVQAGDKLLVYDTPDRLREYKQVLGAKLYSGDRPWDEDEPLTSEDQQSAEMAVTAGSRLAGVRLSDAGLDWRYNLIVLALHRASPRQQTVRSHLHEEVLRTGDVLLVQGAPRDIAAVKNSGDLLVLDGTADLPHTKKAPLALAIMAAVILLASLGVLPIAVSATLGCLVMVLTGCLGWRDTSRALSVQVIMLIVASLALGTALTRTGAAGYLAGSFLALTSGLPPAAILSGVMLLLAVITNVMSNNAAAVIGTPIAVSIAQRLGLPTEAFVLAVLFGANMSFATPMGYKTNILVMNAGGYVFSDFVRAGVPLVLITWVVLSLLLCHMYGLTW